jgi:putative endonuclease
MYYLYILQSNDRAHYYIGATKNLSNRLAQHNNGNSKSTKPYRPWLIIYSEEYNTKQDAMKREYYLKSPKGYLEKKKIFNKSGEVA